MQFKLNYKDGRSFYLFENISNDKIERNIVSNVEVILDSKTIFTLHIEDGQTLIYRKRVYNIRDNSNNADFVYLLGWKQNINGQSIQSLNYIFPDGIIHQAGRWRDQIPFHEPEWSDFEK